MKGNDLHHIIALTLHVNGLVQGVGFRPFVYRLAREHNLNGWVVNRTDGVTIKVEGQAGRMAEFVEDVRYKAPVASQIEEITVDQDMPEGLQGFFILASQDMSNETSEISPDIAVCPDCLNDMQSQPHRKNYPFINCTNCGPRFSIIKDFPYDRAKTTMAPFTMCEQCNSEFSEISDRRFHAQPVACSNCGPQYAMHSGGDILNNTDTIINRIASLIESGGIVAIKGIGGFHLMCNALDENAVDRLRQIKMREGKPFAVMFRDIESIREYAVVSAVETDALLSWKRPVVVLNAKKPVASGVTMQLHTLGAFLPYMPIHHLLFEKLNIPCVVLTSGNIADEPIIISNEEAINTFSANADGIVLYNREIYNRTDDSVVRIICEKQFIIRRSRGFTPSPVKLDVDVDGIFATGAELSNTFCIGKGNRAYMSQHIGDLKNHETLKFFEEAQLRFRKMFRVELNFMASDLHPDYLSTRFAKDSGLDMIQVQHHHAHIASCMAENGIDEKVIGVAFDGTGYGSDGNIWGSEFMVCDYHDFERLAHFEYMPMPGGDKASQEPWRMGLSLLHQAFGEEIFNLDLPFIKSLESEVLRKIVDSINKRINCPVSSGAGRLFDAIAAISGICTHARYHAEAPVRLESAIQKGISEHYSFELSESISFLPAVKSICNDIRERINPGIISAKFHNTIVQASLRMIEKISGKSGLQKVALSGGTFQNKYLLESLEARLVANNYIVLTHSKVPCNDGGIALGQIAVAARRRNNLKTVFA